MALPQQTLCYVFHQPTRGPRQVLLGRKLRGFGEGLIMGLGGHVEPGESDAEVAVFFGDRWSGQVVASDEIRPPGIPSTQYRSMRCGTTSATGFHAYSLGSI